MSRFAALLLSLCFASTLAFGQINSGIPNFSAVDSHTVDTVNLQNLNIVLSVPVKDKSGLMPFSFGFNENSSISKNSAGNAWTLTAPVMKGTANGSLGLPGISIKAGSVNLSGICPDGVTGTVIYGFLSIVLADGSSHPLPQSDSVDYSFHSPGFSCITSTFTDVTTDGSGLTATVSVVGPPSIIQATVVSPSGTTISGVVQASLNTPALSIVDPSGNSISMTSTAATSFTDSLGLTALSASYATGGNSYSWTDVNVGTQQVTTINTNTTLSSSFGCSGISDISGSQYLPTKVNYPDGSYLGLSYGTAGRIHVLTLPKTGTVTYSFGSQNCTYGVPASLTRVTSDGTTTYTWAAVNNGSGHWGNTTTVVDNGGNKTVYTFTGLTSTGNAAAPIIQALTKIARYQGSSTLLTTDVYCYNGGTGQPGNCATAVVSLPITEVDVYHTINGMANSSRMQTTYDTYGNVLISAKYDFGGTTPTIQTTATYGSWNGSTCVAVSSTINDKPCDVVTVESGSTIGESRFTYDATGNLIRTRKWTGSTWLTNTTASVYNSNGTISTAYDLANNATTYSYGTGSCSGAFPTSIASGGLTTYKTWDCTGGVLVKSSIPNNSSAVTTYGYANSSGTADPFWRVNSVTDPLGNMKYANYAASSTNNVFSFGSSISNTTLTADSYGRPVNSQAQQGPSNTQYDTVTTAYGWSTNYRSVFTSIPCSTTSGGTCATGSTTLTDPLGRPFTISDAGGGVITKTYTQNDVLTALSPAPAGEHQKQTQQEYDGLGRLETACAIETSGGSSCGQNTGTASGVVTSYAYTAASGSTTTTVTRGSQTRTKKVDALGRVTLTTTPEGGTTHFYYDVQAACSGSVAGHLTRTTDPNGNSICYFYDSLGRVTTIKANGTACRLFYYDNSTGFSGTIPTGITINNPYGHTVEAATTNCSTTLITDEWFSYDKDGHATDMWESTPHSGGYYHSTLSYFANGTPDVLTLWNGAGNYAKVTYGLDGEGRLSTAASGSQTIVAGTTYNAASQPTLIQLGTGTDEDDYAYDPSTGRMTGWTFTVGSSNEAASLTWNANGTLRTLGITDGFNATGTQTCNFGTSSVMGYDDLGRLLSDDCGSTWAQTFSYDQYNNLTKSGSITWNPGYSATHNRYTLAGTSYDTNGNLTADTFHNYMWNEFSKLATVDSTACGTSGECITYDASGRAVEVSNGSAYTEIWFTPMGKSAVMNGTTLVHATIPMPGGGTLFQKPGGIYYYQHKDWLGSARLSSSVAGHTIIADRAFAPYGEMYQNFGATDELNFTGDTQDIVPGMFDTPNRELAPNQGRWISPDPAGSGWNLYAYAANPNSSVDPSGLYSSFNGGHGPISTDYGCGGHEGCSSMATDSIMFVINGYPLATGTDEEDGSDLFADYDPSLWVNSGPGSVQFNSTFDGGIALESSVLALLNGFSTLLQAAADSDLNREAGCGDGTLNCFGFAGVAADSSFIASLNVGAINSLSVPMSERSLLSDLPASVLQSFAGGQAESTTFLNAQTLFRLEGADGSFSFGSYYGFSAPANAAEGNAMYNISAFSPNPMSALSTYQAPAGMTVPAGRVAGGTAFQAYIQGGQGLSLTSTTPIAGGP